MGKATAKIADKLRRYFVANPAPIVSIKRTNLNASFVRTPCGNADGFFWGNWQVMWRRPYADCWHFDGVRWTTRPSVPEWCERCQGNGELVTDWDRYIKGDMDASGEEYVEPCPDCDGEGYIAKAKGTPA